MRLKSLFQLADDRYSITDQPLLSADDINQLIAAAGRSKKVQLLSSNQFSQFGEQASSMAGSGLDFADRRHYVAGDDPRFIDWKASARSQQTLVKNYFAEVSTPVCIVIDRSSSMMFGTRKRLKLTQAIRAGLTTGVQMLRSGHSLACLLLDSPDFWQPAQNNLSSFRHTIEFAARACPPQYQAVSKVCWSKVSDALKNNLPSGSRVIIVSDFFQFDVVGQKALQQLSYQYDVSAVQIIDPSESELPRLGDVSLYYGHKVKNGLKDADVAKQFNLNLQQKLKQQADWFNSNNCHFVRLHSNDELNVSAGLF